MSNTCQFGLFFGEFQIFEAELPLNSSRLTQHKVLFSSIFLNRELLLKQTAIHKIVFFKTVRTIVNESHKKLNFEILKF